MDKSVCAGNGGEVDGRKPAGEPQGAVKGERLLKVEYETSVCL